MVAADYVERDEFRLLLMYLRQYFEMFVAFNRIDVNFDKRVSRDEFRLAVEDKQLQKWGIIVEPENIDTEFDVIDGNAGGQILFDEVRTCRKLDAAAAHPSFIHSPQPRTIPCRTVLRVGDRQKP